MSLHSQTRKGAVPDLDPLLSTRTDLRIMTMLCSLEEGDQMTLKRMLDVLQMSGDDSRDALSEMEKSGYIVLEDVARAGILGRWIGATPTGRAAFRANARALGARLSHANGS